AERVLQRGRESFERMGALSMMANLSAMLAQALYAQGRTDEALELTKVGERAPRPDDLSSQILWRAVRGKLLASLGQIEDAERFGHEAVALAGSTDFLVVHGDALADLAETLHV